MSLRARTAVDFVAVFILCLVALDSFGAQISNSGLIDGEKQTLAAIAKISDTPTAAAILTHNDGARASGLPLLPKAVQSISRENCEELMGKAPPEGERGAPNLSSMPTKTYVTPASAACRSAGKK
jgi:hypothetical protein